MLFVGLVLLTGCDAPTRPERQGQITALTVDATLAASGSLALKDRVTFVGDRGGVVPMRAPVLATVKDLTLDGSPRTDATQSGTVELRALRRAVDVTATVDGIVERYADIVVVTVPLWGSPSDGAADDPLVPVTGTLHLPAAPLDGSIHWHGALDATFATAGADVIFRANVTMGKDADLVFGLPAGAMPAVHRGPPAVLRRPPAGARPGRRSAAPRAR
jgi:hypothetical protein